MFEQAHYFWNPVQLFTFKVCRKTGEIKLVVFNPAEQLPESMFNLEFKESVCRQCQY